MLVTGDREPERRVGCAGGAGLARRDSDPWNVQGFRASNEASCATAAGSELWFQVHPAHQLRDVID